MKSRKEKMKMEKEFIIEEDEIFGIVIKIKVDYENTVIFKFYDGYQFDSVKFHSIYRGSSKIWRPSNKYEFLYLATRYLGDSEKAECVHEDLKNILKEMKN